MTTQTTVQKTVVVLAVLVAAGAGAYFAMRGDSSGRRDGSGLGKEFTYDIARQRKTPASLLAYREIEPIATGMAQPRGIAVDKSGRLWVAGDQVVRQCDPFRSAAVEFATSQPPYCLAVDGDGRFYVGVKDHVEVYDPNGKLVVTGPNLGPDARLTSVAVGESDLFLADAGNRIVHRCDLSGKVTGAIGRRDPNRNIPGFVIPSPHFDLAIGSDTLLRVANPGMHRVEAYTFDGDLEFAWGGPSMEPNGFCGCCNPTDFAILPGGGFVTAEKGLPRVKICSPQGNLVSLVAGPEMFNEDAEGLDVAADAAGRIFVLDPARKTVRVFVLKTE